MIFVTGASGFVGRSLLHRLQQKERAFKVYDGRINDPMRLRQELGGVETVFHLAGAETRGSSSLLQHVDVEGTERLLEESVRAGVQHIILLSRIGADPNSLYPLLRAKGAAERRIERSDIPYTIVRSTSLFGIDDRFLNVIASLAAWTWPFVWLPGGGRVVLQPLWVVDLARCLEMVLERPDLHNETVVVGGEEQMRYRELAHMVIDAADLRRIPLKIDLRIVRPLARLTMGWWPRPPVTRFFMDRFSVPEVVPVDSVLHNFGFRPGRIGDHIAYLRRLGLRRRLFRL